ncbi:MAG TPA: hypothetical protein VJU86_13955 [Pyrinomonadaceae bacterium]|nr:hypothetical protein [Pyrinomonadaceae bacterium]
MSESLKFSHSHLKSLSAIQEWPVGLSLPRPEVHSVSPFDLVASPFNEERRQVALETCALPLVKKLCNALRTEEVSYCHWKSNWKLSRWLGGHGDLDLLVSTSDSDRFLTIIFSLGFVQAISRQQEDEPAIAHYYGWDAAAEKFVHLHVYSRLLVGHDLTNNYRLPIEEILLNSVSSSSFIPVPQPELELIVFVVRKVLSFWSAETMLRRFSGRAVDFEKTASELDYLELHTERSRVYQLLPQVFPTLSVSLFEACVESLRIDSSITTRVTAQRRLEKVIATHARRSRRLDGALRTWRFSTRLFNDHILKRPRSKHSANGGSLIALVGGDGSGKTTAVKGVRKWLGESFEVKTFHFGKPRRSPITIAVILALRGVALVNKLVGKPLPQTREYYSSNRPGYLRMVRWVCAARDRHRIYLKARHFVARGGIAICDRYLVRGISLMDGPNIEETMRGAKLNVLSKALKDAETKRYQLIQEPDLLLILRVDPEIAVRRKTDEREQHVRPRSQEIWEKDWSNTRAHVIDAGKSAAEVLADLRTKVWRHI